MGDYVTVSECIKYCKEPQPKVLNSSKLLAYKIGLFYIKKVDEMAPGSDQT